MESGIFELFEEGKIIPYFQPILDSKENKIYKYEVLCRVDIKGSEVNPFAKFGENLPSEIYKKITIEILSLVLEKIRLNPMIEFSINLTKFDLEDAEHLKIIEEILEKFKNQAQKLVFEITEGEEFKDTKILKDFIDSFKSKYNCKFALDDFGKGYSNITYITDLDFDFIKFDGSLVTKINEIKSEQIINYLAQLFTNLNMEVVAEFVKDEQIYKKLEKLQIKYYQGNYIGVASANFNLENKKITL